MVQVIYHSKKHGNDPAVFKFYACDTDSLTVEEWDQTAFEVLEEVNSVLNVMIERKQLVVTIEAGYKIEELSIVFNLLHRVLGKTSEEVSVAPCYCSYVHPGLAAA